MKNAKLLKWILCLCCLLAALCAFTLAANAKIVDSGYCGAKGNGSNLTWTLDDAGTLTISGTGAMNDYDCDGYEDWGIEGYYYEWYTSAPWGGSEYNSQRVKNVIIQNGVTNIGNYAFLECTELTSVTIGNGVTSIGYSAFSGCTELTSVTIGNGVTSIGSYAFSGCTGLTKVNISSLQSWCGISFRDSSDNPLHYAKHLYLNGSEIKNLVIPDSVTSIGNYAFYGCTGLTSVTISDSVTSIGSSAFYGCTGLTSVTISDSVTSIGSFAFYGCTSLTKVNISSLQAWCGINFDNCYANPLYYANHLYLNGSEIKNLVIPDSVTSIGYNTFYNCTGLTSVTIGNGVTSIKGSAFYGCTNLASMSIGNSVTSINWTLFSGCTNLKNINVSVGNTKYSAVDNCVIETASKTLVFGNQYSLMPDDGSVTSIGSYAFYGCTGLTAVTIPDSVTNIGGCAFSGCAGLTSVTIPDSVTSIGSYAFYGCTRLISVTIPDSVTSIGSNAFSGCTGLTKVNISSLQAWCGINFDYNYANPLYYANHLYLNGSEIKNLVIPDSVTSIGNYAFYGCTGLTSVTIPDSVTSIESYALKDCANLASVTIGNSVTSIGSNAFSGCTNLPAVIIPDSVTSIGSNAFSGCTGLTAVSIPDSVTSIGNSAFYDCTGLISVTIGNGVTSIGTSAFSGYTAIEKLTVGKPIEQFTVAEMTISKENLTTVVITNGATSIKSDAFKDCKSLINVTIQDGMTAINTGAFYGCTNLATVSIPASVTEIKNNAFYNDSKLKTVYFGGTEQQWKDVLIEDGNIALLRADVICQEEIPVVEPEALDASRVTRTPTVFYANGKQQQPTVTVKNAAGEVLTEGVDYKVTYPVSVEPGSYLVQVKGVNGYKGMVRKGYTIKESEALDAANVTRTPTAFYANGKQQQPTVTVTNGAGKMLIAGTDYKVTYPTSVEPGTYMVQVEGINGYKGMVRKGYTIKAVEALDAANVTRTPTVFYANGKQQQPEVKVTNAAGKTLIEGTDYKVTYPVSIEPGTYLVQINGVNGYKGMVRKGYSIKAVEALDAANVTRTPTVFYANGQQQQPEVTVKNAAGKTLTEGVDYKVTYPVSIEPGTYLVQINGVNGYKGMVRKGYSIKAVEALDAANVTRTPIVFYANGKQQQPTVTVKNAAGKVLTEGVDYKVTYPVSVEPGSYLVQVDGLNGYKGMVRKGYTIKEREALDASRVTRTPITFTYNGEQQQPEVTVKNAAGKTLTEGVDYKVTYPVSVEPGTYMVQVEGVNGYKGTIRKGYSIK